MTYTEIAEAARILHHAAAGQDDQAAYRRSETLFRAAIAAAYPTYDAEALYALWVDNMEDLDWQIKVYDTDPEFYSTFRV